LIFKTHKIWVSFDISQLSSLLIKMALYVSQLLIDLPQWFWPLPLLFSIF